MLLLYYLEISSLASRDILFFSTWFLFHLEYYSMIINAYTWSRPPKYCTLLCYRAHSQCEFFLLRGNIVLLTFLGVFIIMAGWSCNDYSFHSNISFFCNCSIFNYLSNYPYCDCDHIIIIHLNFQSNKNFSFLLFICKCDIRKKNHIVTWYIIE